MVSPFPPRGSGIADYTASLVEELRHEYRIDLDDCAYTPLPSLADPDLVAADARLLPRIASVAIIARFVYQMGANSWFHQFHPLMLYPSCCARAVVGPCPEPGHKQVAR